MGARTEEFSKGQIWGAVNLIFVSVGTQDRPFNRLLSGVDAIAETLDEEIVAQIGYSTYIPHNVKSFRFCGHKEMLHYIEKANVIISQAGFGIIGNAIRYNKPMVLVPREFRYGEAVDKQYELAEYLASQNRSIVCVRNLEYLAEGIDEVRNINAEYKYKSNIPAIIEDFITKNIILRE